RVRRGSANGQIEPLDLVKIMDSLPPRDTWTKAKLIEALPKLAPGEVLVAPPLPKDADEAASAQAEATFQKMYQVARALQ
ncbi:MAG: hypothetical protein RLZZ522_1835, partial [Verrucomicrobiota bacterium]